MKIAGAIMWAVGLIVFVLCLNLSHNISNAAWFYTVGASLGTMTFVFGARLSLED